MILVDTSAWFASVVPSDTDYQVATLWMRQNTQPLLTTDYVIDETLTLLRVRGHNSRAMALGEGLFTGFGRIKWRKSFSESKRDRVFFTADVGEAFPKGTQMNADERVR